MIRTILLFTFLAFVNPAHAALTLPDPAVLLQKASQGRTQLRDVILDIASQISEMRDPKTFDKYFYILPQLKTYSNQFKLDDVYPQAVEKLGLKMVAQGSRWLLITRDDAARLEYYLSWSDADVVGNFYNATENEIRDETNKALLTKAIENLEVIIPIVDKKFPSRFDLKQSFRTLQSSIAVKFLRQKLPKQEALYWIEKLADINTMNEYLDLVQQSVFTIDNGNRQLAHEVNELLISLRARAHKILPDPPLWLDNYIGEVQIEVIMRMIRMEEEFLTGEFEKALEMLSVKQLQGLSLQWVNPELLPKAGYAAHYVQLTKSLVLLLQKSGLKQEASDLEKAVAKASAAIFVSNIKGEGTYVLYNSKGVKWIFTIVEVKKGLLFASLVDEKLFAYKGFFYLGYNLNNGQFVATAREPDLDTTTDLPVAQFKIEPNGDITLIDLYAPPDQRELKGKRTQIYDSYTEMKSTGPVVLEGEYKGEIFLPDNSKATLMLTITGVNKESVGRLSNAQGRIYDFNYGTAVDQPYVYLTTGRLPRTTWVQIRAYMKDGKLRGKMIIGGRGISNQEFVLDKLR